MALWYNNGTSFDRVRVARKNLGLDAYLIAPGPSLSDIDPAILNAPGIFTLGINTSYPRVRPCVWMGMDTPECYDRRLWHEPFPKICRGGYQNILHEDMPLADFPMTYFVDVAKPENKEHIFVLRNHDSKLVWNKNTLEVAIHYLIWIGAKRIHLVGVDLGGDKDYYDDRVLKDEHRKRNRRLYSNQLKTLKWMHDRGKMYGIEFISCSPTSPINEFCEYREITQAIAKSQENVPDSGVIRHAADAYKTIKRKGKNT